MAWIVRYIEYKSIPSHPYSHPQDDPGLGIMTRTAAPYYLHYYYYYYYDNYLPAATCR